MSDYAFSELSNFCPADICIDRTIYPTAEHAFQCMKCVYDEYRRKVTYECLR